MVITQSSVGWTGLPSLRGRPSIKMRQTIKWCLAICLTIVRPNMFWLLQSLLIFYQTIHFGQAISLLPNMYSIGKLRQKRPQQEHRNTLHQTTYKYCFPAQYIFLTNHLHRHCQCLRIGNACTSNNYVNYVIICRFKGRVGITLTKTDYFGKRKHVWQTNIISAKYLVLTN